ncbi:alpha-1,3-mannosyl-glycoprotein 4-beta-N-acetylglucosaminyltransferase B [Ischnura elegans]|uniref:alpha-1,3-mannosyl-glycoprotein 4-beta-N-acetylglucosaminyltransferase B n=1 Tax=Ischnura elegans TaxID=197161 RepID=UPI001ED8AB42|nr:alpha-1,3-mannosyl-glycoprotein 4-beta-N-acetylglucosaminyltransferase B [Ischnura elegans]
MAFIGWYFPPMVPLRFRRHGVLLLFLIILVPSSVLILFSSPDLSGEQALVEQLAELQLRLLHLEQLHRTRQEEVQMLATYIGQVLLTTAPPKLVTTTTTANPGTSRRLPSPSRHLSSPSPLRDAPAAPIPPPHAASLASVNFGFNSSTGHVFPAPPISPQLRALLINVTGHGLSASQAPLHLPSVYNFLPHLLDEPLGLRPAFTLSGGRTGVSVVLGVPTVKREVQSYLLATLKNLMEGMSKEEEDDALIVVFIGETDREYILQVARDIETQFPKQVTSGLLEVVAPAPSYYPSPSSLRETLGDTPERVAWRAKQSLDFAFLMSYCSPRGRLYVQLEDDVLARPGYVSVMKDFALGRMAARQPWFVIEFCQLGFIGKMFKGAELPWLIQFFLMFYNDKPVDWLLEHLIHTKICRLDKDPKFCKKARQLLWVHYKPSLFQHIGTHSSLKGKVQKLKDRHFGKVPLFFPHASQNPPATVDGGRMKAYRRYTLSRAYAGETFFWGLLPQPGDTLTFKFTPPVQLKRFLFRSGNAEHPSDRFYNTTVELLPLSSATATTSFFVPNPEDDGYITVGKFDAMGIAEGNVSRSFGPLQELRLKVHSESDNWAILSEILLEPDTES